MQPPDDLERDLGPRLSAALGGETPPLSPETDAFLTDAARTTARRLAARRRRRWLGAAVPAVAVAATLAMALIGRARRDPHDVNGDGRLDILDAFALARTIERGGTLQKEWDFNLDRRVDRRDVDWAARAVVRVK